MCIGGLHVSKNTYLTGISAWATLEASVISIRLKLATVAVETVS